MPNQRVSQQKKSGGTRANILARFSYGILLLFALSLFAGIVRHVALGGTKLGPFTRPVQLFSSFPSLVNSATSQLLTPPDTFQKKGDEFEPINKLTKDIYALYSISIGKTKRKVVLKNLRNDEEILSWIPQKHFKPNDRLLHPLLVEGKEIVASVPDGQLMRIGSSGAIKWLSDSNIGSHHALSIDANQDLWIPGVRIQDDGTPLINHSFAIGGGTEASGRPKEIPYRDDLIVKWDAKTGEVLYTKSLTDLFTEHGLLHHLNRTSYPHDPFHLNDIEPALTSTDYFEKGDLFLSIRHLSMIVHYRPDSNRVLNVIQGPFWLPHDVDIVSNNRLTIVNNQSIPTRNTGFDYAISDHNDKQGVIEINHSNVLYYDFATGSFVPIFERHFIEQGIFTHTEGLSEILDDGSLFFEQQNSGILWVLNEDSVVYKAVIESDLDGYQYLLNWTRIVNPREIAK